MFFCNNATEVKRHRQRDVIGMLLEDVVVNWLHSDPHRIPEIRQNPDHKIFLLDKNGPQSSDAVSWLYIYIYYICIIKCDIYIYISYFDI